MAGRTVGPHFFRWRSYVPLAVLALYLWVIYERGDGWRAHMPGPLWGIGGAAVSAVGLAIRVYAIGHAPAHTSDRNTRAQKAATLNTTGAYAVLRHPLYVGNLLVGLGAALFGAVWWVVPVYVLAFCAFYVPIALAEEDYLRERFGDAFTAWAHRTPAIFPRPGNFTPPSLAFSWRRALREEHRSVITIVLVFFAMDVARTWAADGHPGAHMVWMSLAVGATATWVLLRLISRRTHLLRDR